MKNTKRITTMVQTVFMVAALANATSCNGNKKQEGGQEMAEEYKEEKFDYENDAHSEKDAKFLVNAAEINLEEVMLGELAEQRGRTADVKILGKMMMDAHTKSMKELTALAERKVIAIPTSVAATDATQSDYLKLRSLPDTDFDTEYCNMMVTGHKSAIKIFEKASRECTDPDIRNWAIETLPELKKHLAHSLKCQESSKKIEISQE